MLADGCWTQQNQSKQSHIIGKLCRNSQLCVWLRYRQISDLWCRRLCWLLSGTCRFT